MKTYFAYGSNLCFARFVSRVPSAKFRTVAKLAGFKIVFHKKSQDGSGKATIVKAAKEDVYGAVYEFDDKDLDSLRRAEGWPKHYEESEGLVVQTPDGQCETITYIATAQHSDKDQVPYDWYVDLIREGARRFGLPENYVAQLVSITTKADPDSTRSNRERSYLR